MYLSSPGLGCPKGGRKLKTMNKTSAYPQGLYDSVDIIVQRRWGHRLFWLLSILFATHPPAAASVVSVGILPRALPLAESIPGGSIPHPAPLPGVANAWLIQCQGQ